MNQFSFLFSKQLNKILHLVQWGLAAAVFILVFTGCETDNVSNLDSTSSYCSGGGDVKDINDNAVSAAVKAKIYAPAPGYVSTSSPLYNANLPVVIIPFCFKTKYPANTAITKTVIRRNFFDVGTGSVNDFFRENSWDQFNMVEAGISDVVHDDQDPVFYGGEGAWVDKGNFVKKICEASTINWAELDKNHDHNIDEKEAQIIFADFDGNEPGGATRQHTVDINTNAGVFHLSDWIAFVSWKRNDDRTRGTDDIRYNFSTICHELAHAMFHLPDRYANFCGSGPSGSFDLMSDNCSWKDLTMYDRMKLGWIKPRIITTDAPPQCYSIPASESKAAAVILLSTNVPAAQASEYWIISNRNRASSPYNFDRDPGLDGLQVWWVDGINNKIALVASRNSVIKPSTINYAPGDVDNILFKYDEGDAFKTYVLMPERSGMAARAIRGVSPTGSIMSANF